MMRILEIALAVILLLAAFYTFDWHYFDSWLVSSLLLLGALENFSAKKEHKKALRKISLPILILLLVRLLFFR